MHSLNRKFGFAIMAAVAAIGALAACSSSAPTDPSPSGEVQQATNPTGCSYLGTPYTVVDNQLWTQPHHGTPVLAFTVAPSGNGPDGSTIDNALWTVAVDGTQSPTLVNGQAVAAPTACIADPVDPTTYDPSCGHVSHNNLRSCGSTGGSLPCVLGAPIPASVDGGPGVLPDGALVSNEGTSQNTCVWPEVNFFGTEVQLPPIEVAYADVNGFLVECSAGPCVGNTPPPAPVVIPPTTPTYPNLQPNPTCLIDGLGFELLGGQYLFEVVNNGASIQPVTLPVIYQMNGNNYVIQSVNGVKYVFQVNADDSLVSVSQENGTPVPLSFLASATPTYHNLALGPNNIPLVCESTCTLSVDINENNHHILTPSGYGWSFEDTGVSLAGNYSTVGPVIGVNSTNSIGVTGCSDYDNDNDADRCTAKFLDIEGYLFLETDSQKLVETGRSDRFCCGDLTGFWGDNHHHDAPQGYNP